MKNNFAYLAYWEIMITRKAAEGTKVVETYRKVDIIESCGYYYPSVNTNVECRTVIEAKDWIDRVWSFTVEVLNETMPYILCF